MSKKIGPNKLASFLVPFFPNNELLVTCKSVENWESLESKTAIFHLVQNDAIEDGLKYGLSVFIETDDFHKLIESLAFELSHTFECSTCCDASRIILKESNSFYSLLFEGGQVFLVDDFEIEKTGRVKKIVELSYKPPNYFRTH